VNKWCANPIWCIRDLITNERYGVGKYISSSLVDDVLNLEYAKYAEEKVSDGAGGYEKRFRLDVVIDSTGRALDIIAQLCSTFRGAVLYAEGKVKVKIDKEETATQLFGMGNIIADSYKEVWKSKKEQYNMMYVTFNDSAKNYEEEKVLIYDKTALLTEPPRPCDIRVYTNKLSYAIREGKFHLRMARLLNRSIQFRAMIDAVACMAYDVISFSHDVTQIGFSGRVGTGSTTTAVVLDRTVTVESGKTYKLTVQFADDTIEEQTISSPPGSYTTVEVASAFSQAPANFDNFSFGETGKVKKDYRVIDISNDPSYEVDIAAIEVNANAHIDGTLELPTDNYSALVMSTPPVTNLSLTEHLNKLADGTIENCIDVWFNRPSMAGYFVKAYDRARIYLSDDSGASWEFRGETAGTSFTIQGGLTDLSTYRVAVVSVSKRGEQNAVSSAPYAEISMVGKTAAPSDIATFIIRQSRDRLYMTWTGIDDVDLNGYEIRYGDSWESGVVVATYIKTTYLIALDIREGTGQSYWIKAIDTSGNYSETPTEALLTVENVPFTNIVESYSEQTSWGGDKSLFSNLPMRVTVTS
jgi:predicted phage tail protein